MTHPHHNEWIVYLTFAFLTLVCDFLKYCYDELKMGKSDKEIITAYVFERSASNIAEWTATICVVWGIGFLYIDRTVDWALMSFVQSIPLHKSLAALMGVIAESTAPALFRWIVGKVPWGGA